MYSSKRLRELACSLAEKSTGPYTAWLDLKAWASNKGSEAHKAAVFEFLDRYNTSPEAVPLFPEVLQHASRISSSLPENERKTLIELADRASATAKGGFAIISPDKDRIVRMPLSSSRPAPVLSFRPRQASSSPRLSVPGPLVPSPDIERFIEARDTLFRINDKLHELPAPIKAQRKEQRKQEYQQSPELMSFSMPFSSKPVLKADKGEELVRSLIEKMKEQAKEEKKERRPSKAAAAGAARAPKKAKAKPKGKPKKKPAKKKAKKKPKEKPKKKAKKKKPAKKKARKRARK